MSRLIRVVFYLLAFFYLLFSEVKEEYSFIFCPFKSLLDLDCYLCGMTRAFISMFHFNFDEALNLNPLVIIIYPALIFIAIQDTFIILKDYILKKESNTFIEYLINLI